MSDDGKGGFVAAKGPFAEDGVPASAGFFAVPCPHGRLQCVDCLMLSAYRLSQENGALRWALEKIVALTKPKVIRTAPDGRRMIAKAHNVAQRALADSSPSHPVGPQEEKK